MYYGDRKSKEFIENALRANSKFITSSTRGDIGVYCYPGSPPCQKVFAYCDYYRIKYTDIEVDFFSKKELAFSPDYKKLPIAIIDGVQVNDSTCILEKLHGSYCGNEREEMKFIDEKLVLAA